MREYRTPPVAASTHLGTMADPVYHNASADPDAVAFRRWKGGGDVTAGEFAAEVTAVGKGLIAIGVAAGDRVAILADTDYEWTLCDYAIWAVGAVSVPVYHTASTEQVAWILADSGAGWCLVGSAEQAATVTDTGVPVRLLRLDQGVLGELAARAAEVPDERFQARRAVAPDEPATIIYTSGTTGRAKGVVVTHHNFLSNLDGFVARLEPVFAPGGAIVLFLSPAHIFTRTMQCAALLRRVRITHVPASAELAAALREVRPTVLPLVPRFMEKLRDASDDAAATLGGRCTAIIVGGAPHDAGVADFYRDAGVAVYEGYGLTEVCGPATINGPAAVRDGTVGRPLPGVTVRLADDGEVLVRGDCVFGRYHRNPAATEAALVDGWLHTGDLGSLDDGYLTITGRKKDLIVTAGGKNVDPTTLESRLRAHPLISQAVVVGDRRPYVACLVTLDRAALRDGVPVRTQVQEAVDAANRAVSRAEAIRAFHILDREFTVADGDLTASGKVRRDAVSARHRAEIEAMYRSGPGAVFPSAGG